MSGAVTVQAKSPTSPHMIIKVAIYIPTFHVGGAEKVTVQLANYFSENGLDITIICLAKDGELFDQLLPSLDVIVLSETSFTAIGTLPSLIKVINALKPDILLSTLYNTGLASVIASLFAQHKPLIIGGLHNSILNKSRYSSNLKEKYFLIPLIKLLFSKCDAFIPVSNQLAEELLGICSLPSSRVFPILNPSYDCRYPNLAREPISHPWLSCSVSRGYKTLCAVGRLVPQKGFDILLKAFYIALQTAELRLVIVGDGPEYLALTRLASKLGVLDYVDFLGHQTNPLPYMSGSDLFILSSRYEGMPNVLVEALSCQIPIIASDCETGPREVLANGYYGKLVQPLSAEALASSIIQFANEGLDIPASPEELLSRAKQFSISSAGDQYIEVFNQLLK